MFRAQPKERRARTPRRLFECQWCGETLSSSSEHYRCPYKEAQTDSQIQKDVVHSNETVHPARSRDDDTGIV